MDIRASLDRLPVVAVTKKIRWADAMIPRHAQWVLYIILLLIADAAMTFLAFWMAFYFRFGLFVQYFDPNGSISIERYQFLLYSVPLLMLVVYALNGMYVKDNLLGGPREYSKVVSSTSAGFLLIVIAGFLGPTLIIARAWLLMAWGGTIIFVGVSRFLLRRFIYNLRKLGFFLTPAVVVGANQEGRMLAEQLLQWQTSGLHLVGFVDKKVPETFPLFHGLVCLGSVEQLDRIIEQYQIGEIILASSAFSTRDYLIDIFRKYGVTDKVNIRMSSGLYEILTTSLSVNEYAYVPLVYVNKVRLTGSDIFLKFILDYAVAVTGIILISPLLLLLALLVKLTSPGPIFHRRLVMGLNGKHFHALKFRTMYINGEEILERYPEKKEELRLTKKIKDDPRVTRLGRFLRRLSLDELPQLFNVLKREMSLVGPRMIAPDEVAMYKQFDMNLLTVLPGITGLWQVSGRSDITYDERVRLDMYYVRNWSIWLDLQLLFQTIPVVIRGHGAY